MSNLDNMVQLILQDAEQKVEEIRKKTEDNIAVLKQEANMEMEKELEENLKTANEKMKLKNESLLRQEELKTRDEQIQNKQRIIEKLLEKVYEKLLVIDTKDFEVYVVKTLKTVKLNKTDQIIMPYRYKDLNMNVIKNDLNVDQCERMIEFSEDINDGFIVRRDKYTMDCSFRSAIEEHKDEWILYLYQNLF